MFNVVYNIDNLKKEIENARCKNYFGRIESFYKKLPKTECEKCGKCCYDPPCCTFIEFMYAYELYDTFDKETKRCILAKALRRYTYSLVDKFSEPCCFLDNNNMCMIHKRSCISCKRWGTYGKEQYESNWEVDSEYNREFKKFYREKYNIVISDENTNTRLAFCDKAKIVKNPYNIQEIDYQKYIKSLLNVDSKSVQQARIKPTIDWSINEWLVYFTFGMNILESRIKIIQKLQSGNSDAVNQFLDGVDYSIYL